MSEDTDGYVLNGLELQKIGHILRPAIPSRQQFIRIFEFQRWVCNWDSGNTRCSIESTSRSSSVVDSCVPSAGDPFRESADIRGPGSFSVSSVSCELGPLIPGRPASPGWSRGSTLDLEDSGFEQPRGMFRDGNSLWVIEQPISVAAHFTIQDDGTIVRS